MSELERPRAILLTADDWAEFREIRLRALADAPGAFGSTLAVEQPLTESDWRRRLGRCAQFLVRDLRGAIGTAGGFEKDGGAELISMWVDPAARGHSVSDALVTAVAEWAHAARYESLGLWVALDNPAAQRLYERHGFVDTGERQPVRPEEPDRLKMRMSRQLKTGAAPASSVRVEKE